MTDAGKHHTWKTNSPRETIELGEVLGRSLVGGLVIGLVGPLGAGKTVLVKGIAKGNGLDDIDSVTSPTFVLVHEYSGARALFHIDAYRLSGGAELAALGFDEMVDADSVVVVEWANRIAEAMPEDALWITLAATGESSRELCCEARGQSSRECLEALRGRIG